MMTPEEKITQLGLSLPPVSKPAGLYQPVVVSGKLAFLSGQISNDVSGKILAVNLDSNFVVIDLGSSSGV